MILAGSAFYFFVNPRVEGSIIHGVGIVIFKDQSKMRE
jgi:hypothetical protein